MSNVKRRLATILATDCVGFSKHMTENEELTLENLKACRSIIDPLIEEYGGRIFYTAGDSVIADFSSPVECVNAAIKFQKAIADRNIAINKLHNQIKIFPIALSENQNEFLNLNDSSDVEGSAHNNYGLSQSESLCYSTYGTNINYLLKHNILSLPNYIKIDVDGIENLILRGANDLLKSNKLRELSIEIDERKESEKKEIFNLLKRSNFTFVQKKHNEKFIEKEIDKKTFNFIFKKN